MDTTLIVILLAVALVAIIAVPGLFRRKDKEAGTAQALDNTRANTLSAPSAKMATLEDNQSQWFARWLCEQASAQTGMDLTRDPMALPRISDAATKAQAEIDTNGRAEISLPYIAADSSGPKHFQLTVTRDQLASARNRMT